MATEAEIRHEYELRIAREQDPAAQQALRVEMGEAIITAQRQEMQEREVSGWREAALREFPDAVPAEVVGGAAEAMREAARVSHEKYQARITAAADAAREEERQKLMGAAYGGSGGVPPGAQPPNATEAEVAYENAAYGKVRGAIATSPFSPASKVGMAYGQGIRSEMKPSDPVGRNNPAGLSAPEADQFIDHVIRKAMSPHALPLTEYHMKRLGRGRGGVPGGNA